MSNKEKQGWDYITEAVERLYPHQKDPLHFGTLVSWQLGGNDPLEGISIYDSEDFYHFITYGFTELYEKESDNKEYSGYGFELTLKLKKIDSIDEHELKSMAGVLQALGRYVFQSGTVFQPYEYIYTGQTEGMDSNGISKITGFATVMDEDLGTLETPNGKIEFLQLVGLTQKELQDIIDKRKTVAETLELLGHTMTDFSRSDI